MKKRFYYGAMATGLVFTACSSEALNEPDNNRPADADQTLYVKMAIHGDDLNGTRAAGDNGSPEAEGDFEQGTGNESKINNAYFVFYDAVGKQVGEIVQIKLDNAVTENTGATVETYYESVVPVSIRKGELDPAQVVCYINPISPANLQSSLSDIETVTRTMAVSGTAEPLFPMSNSVYYTSPADGTIADGTKPQIAVPVDKAQLYESKEDALGAEAKAIDVYVERYASKLKFTSKDAEAYTTHTTVNGVEVPVSLSFVAEKWALNAESNETYVVKSFRKESAEGIILPDDYTYNDLNTAINGTLSTADSWVWNNADYHRSYWGMSPAYFTATYPEVAGDVNDNSLQTYYTYNDLTKENSKVGYPTTDTDAKYFKETTVGLKALDSKNPAAAMPSVILVGKYKLSVNGTEVEGNPDFYTYLKGSDGKPLVYFAANDGTADSKVAGGESMLKRFINQVTVLYKRVNDGTEEAPKYRYVRLNPTVAADLAMMVGALKIDRPTEAVLKNPTTTEGYDEIKLPARQQTLQFNGINNTTGIYIANGNGYKEIVADDATPTGTQITLTAANRVLMQQVGFANFYNTGMAYFNIPVKHYGWYRAGNTQKEITEGETTKPNTTTIDWGKVRVGDFGMVRNHSYSINISSITGLATGIAGVDDPIVPPAETKDYYVAYKVRILKWAVVPVQNVDL